MARVEDPRLLTGRGRYVDDVTVRVQAELALREAKDHLERRVQERTAALDQTNRALEGEIAERRRVEERVLAERQRLVDVLETLPVYVVLLAQDYHVPFANRFFRERFGESHGRRCFDYLFGRSEPCEVCETYTVLKTGAPHRWEWTGPDGRDYDIYDFPFKDTDGSQLIMEMGIDITARKHAEAELRSQQGHLEQLVEKRTAEIEHRNAQLVEEAAVRQRVEAELLRAKNEWERTFDSVPDLIAIIDNQHRISRMNRAMAKRLRRTPEECLGSHCYECVHGASHPPKVCPLTLTLMDRGEHVAEVHEESLGGDFIVSTTPLVGEDGEMVGSVHVARDITERKLAQAALQEAHDTLERRVRQRTEELAQVNQTLCMISDCNQALVRATTENELVQEICRIIQGQGRYRMAWVGYAERDAAKTVRAVAWAGLEQGYLEQARISWADDERGRGPTGTCIRTRRPCIGHDFLKDPNLAPWREQALAAGFRSSIALPLVADGQAFGALTLYAADVGVFGEQQITLLTELADDLAFGIMARRAALERDHARHVAEERARQLARLATELGRVEQRERQSLARVLHDHLQQLLVGAKYNLASVEGMLRSRFKQRAFREVTRILDEAIAAASSLTAELSPPALHERGLVAGLDWLSRQMRQKHGLRVEVHADHGAEPAGEQARLFLFQAVRELLFNVVKHAKVSCAQVDVARLDGDEVRVVVADDGVGFDPDSLEPGERTSGGFGLFSIRERLSCLGGRLSVDSRPGHGSRFTLVAPVFLPPCQAESSTSAAPPAVAPASGPARGARGDGSPKKPRSASGGRAQATARHPQRRLTKKRRKRA